MALASAHEHLLSAILESSEDAVLSISLDGRIESWGNAAERLYGYAAREMIGQPLSRLLPLYELPAVETLLSHAGRHDFRSRENSERLRKDGSRIFVAIRRSLIRSGTGAVGGILERSRRVDFLADSSPEETPLRLLMEQAPGLLWTTDRNLKISTNWGAGIPSMKIPPGALAGQNVCEFLGCADRYASPIAEHFDALRGVTSHFEQNWKDRVLDLRIGPLRSATREIIGCLAAALDFTDRKKSEEQALYLARHDALTGLANYREFMDRLEREVRRADRSHHSFTLLLLDTEPCRHPTAPAFPSATA